LTHGKVYGNLGLPTSEISDNDNNSFYLFHSYNFDG
jgi:hypothetical protein